MHTHTQALKEPKSKLRSCTHINGASMPNIFVSLYKFYTLRNAHIHFIYFFFSIPKPSKLIFSMNHRQLNCLLFIDRLENRMLSIFSLHHTRMKRTASRRWAKTISSGIRRNFWASINFFSSFIFLSSHRFASTENCILWWKYSRNPCGSQKKESLCWWRVIIK